MASKDDLLKKNKAERKTSKTTSNVGTSNKVPTITRKGASTRNGGYSQEALDRLSEGTYGTQHKAEEQARNYSYNQQKRKTNVAYNKNAENTWNKLNVSAEDENTLRDLKENFGAHASSVMKKNNKSAYWENKYGTSIDDIYKAYDEHAKNRDYNNAKKSPLAAELRSVIPNVMSGITGTAEALTESIAPDSIIAKASKEANQIVNDSKERLRSAVDEVKGEPGAIKNFARQTADTVLPTIGAGILGGKVGGALMSGGLAANRKLQDLEDRGIEGRSKGLQALGYGALEGGANALTVGAFDKVPVNTIFGQALKNAGSGAIENFVGEGAEQILDKVAGGDQSEWDTNKAIAMLNGMTEEDAEKYATKQAWKQIGTTTGMGALTGAGGTIAKQGGSKILSKLFGDSDLPKVEEPKAEAELPKLNAEEPKVDADVTNSDIPVRNYKDLIPEDSYFRNEEFKTQMSELKATRARDNELFDELQSIDKELKQYLDTSETNGDRRIAEVLNSYTDEAKPLLERREQLRAERKNIGGRIAELDANTTSMRDAGRAKELENYQFNSDFKPLSQTEYEGFDITKGTNGDVNDALANGDAMLVEMSPAEYLQRVAYDIFDTSTLGSTINGIETPDNVAKYADAMRNGEKFPILSLTYDGKYGRGQEGRTRALAAYEAGIDKIPVAIIGEPSANPKNIIPKETSSNIDIDALIDDMDFTDEELGINFSNGNVPRIENDADFRLSDVEPSVPRVTNVEPEIAQKSTIPTVNSDMGDGTYRLDDSSVNSTDMGERRAVTNSGLKKGYVTEEQIQNDPVIRDIVERSVQHDDDVTRKAAELYAEKGEQLERDIASGKLRLDNGLAVAESNVILQKLTNGMNAALDNGDMESYQQLKARHDAVLEKNAEAGTDIARSLRMYGYFDHTADGAQVKAKNLQKQAVEKWKSRDDITPQKTEKLATKIINSLNPNQKAKAPKAKLTGEELVKSITASVKKFYGIDIDGASANQIARWQEEGKPAYVIRDEIEHLKNHGTFYEMTDDVKEVLPSSKILDRIFKRMGDDTKPTEGAPKKVNTLEDDIYEITNSLKKEFGSVEEIFDDNSKKILASDVQAVRDRVISVDEAENHIRHFLETGEWYTIDESTPVKKDISNKLAGALSDIGNDTIKAKNKKIPALDYGTSHATNLNKVKNTLELEQSSAFANMTEDGYEFLATMLDDKRPRQQITDELMHWLEHGEFYPIDDTKPTAKVKDSQISKMLERILAPNDIKETYKPKTPKTHAEVVEGIRNSLDDEASGIGGMFSDADVEQLALWKENPDIPNDILFSEIEHKILHGEFFEITQDILEKPKQNAQFNSAMQRIFPGEETEAKANPTFDEIRATIDNSLRDGEFASLSDKFTPDELDYIARRMEYGLSTKDLTTMLQTKLATGSIGLKDETLAQVKSLFDDASQYGLEDKRRVDLEDKAYRLIANDIYGDRTFFEQFEGWRFLSMLGNLKTHIRNTLGNVTQYFVTEAKDAIATAAEEQADKIASLGKGNGLSERYRARLDGNDRALVQASGNDAQTIYARLNDMGRYDNATRGIERARKTFNEKTPFGKFMNAVNDINSNFLDKEDYFFLKKKYQQSLARFLKANGANESIFNSTDKADIDLLEKGRNFAIEEAQKATFHEYSEFADKLTEFSSGLRNSDNVGAKVGGYMVEGLIPFKKTPINILKQGIKYSPASLVKGIGEMLQTVVSKAKGSGKTFSASEVIDDFAAGLTGTGIMALGLFLGKQGLLTGGADDDYNVDNAQTAQGEQNYALKIGNKSYTLDWLAPSSMPLFVGVELSKAIDKISGSENLDFNDYFNLAMGIAEPINEMSMLQGINSTLESLAYGNIGDAAANLATSMATGYVSQGVPTLFGQIARSVDDTRRSTYTGKSGASNTLTKNLIKAENKIPVLSNLNEPFADANGMTQENAGGNFFGRLAYNMLSPGYYQSGNVTDTDRELNRLYESTGEGKVYGNTLDGEVSMGNNNSIKMSRRQMTDAQQIYGQVRTELYDKVINTDWYNNLDDAERVKLLGNIKDFSKKLAERAVADRPLENSDMELYDMYINEGADALVERYRQKKEADALGLDFETYQKKQEEYEGGAAQYVQDIQDALNYGFVQKDGDPDLNNYLKAKEMVGNNSADLEAKSQLVSLGVGGTKSTNTYYTAKTKVPELQPDQYARIYNAIDTDGKDGITQKELKEFYNSRDISEGEVMLLYDIFGNEWKGVPYVTKKGTWSFK